MTQNQKLTLVATIVGSGIVILDASVVNLALPKIAGSLDASFSDLQWIVDGYALSLAALILLGGSLGDIYGRKRMYLFGLSGFGVLSLLCGLAQNSLSLILLRVLQGVFGALLIPGGLAVINTNFEAQERGAAIGSWSAASAIFAGLGPLIGGYILGVASWRWIFFINIPLIIICGICGYIGIQDSRDTKPRRVDLDGALIGALSLAGITYGLIEGPAKQWPVLAIGALVIGILLAAVFVYREDKAKDPMVPLGLFASRNFSGSNIMTFAMYGALSGFFFALVIHLQTYAHYSSIKAGLSLIPTTIILALFSRRVGALATKYGARRFLTIGPLLSALGILLFLRLGAHSSYVMVVLPGIILFGAGLVMVVAPLTTTVMGSVSDESSGIASGVNNAVSRVAGLLIVALLGLFGAAQVFRFAIILSAALAALAGVVSFLTIQDVQVKKTVS